MFIAPNRQDGTRHSLRGPRLVRLSAFSLVEVVISLGIFSFCLIALIGLLNTGLIESQNSAQSTKASHLMTQLIALRLTTNAPAASALPPLNQAADSLSSGPIYVAQDGTVAVKETAQFQLNFRIVPPSNENQNNVLNNMTCAWVMLSWPAGASLTNALGTYEVNFCQPGS